MNRRTLLACSLWLAVAASAHAAADARASVNELERVQLTATRSERAIDNVPNTADVIDRERMDELLLRDLKNVFLYEHGITFDCSSSRFGLGDIRIRGLGGSEAHDRFASPSRNLSLSLWLNG